MVGIYSEKMWCDHKADVNLFGYIMFCHSLFIEMQGLDPHMINMKRRMRKELPGGGLSPLSYRKHGRKSSKPGAAVTLVGVRSRDPA